MNRILGRQLLASLALSTLMLAGAFAAEPASPSIPTDSTPARNDGDAETRQPNCVRDTGTRIKSKKRDCLGVAGRSYSAEELRQTGETNPLDALRRMDPSITGSVR
ncbi:hypothetical protein [Nevskia sp.]|uniref:hypothetical protein n=1 Tax=Nevskia sp. TaxID=1929292 RepID=UPI0025EBC1D2|nr:hypothetical protein [Nevskia sp.]